MAFLRRHRFAMTCSVLAIATYLFFCLVRVDFIPKRSGGFDASLLYIAFQSPDSGGWLRAEDIAGNVPRMDRELWSAFYVDKAREQLRGYTVILAFVIGITFMIEFFLKAAVVGARSVRQDFREAKVEQERGASGTDGGERLIENHQPAMPVEGGLPVPVSDRELQAMSDRPLKDLTEDEYDDLIQAALAARASI